MINLFILYHCRQNGKERDPNLQRILRRSQMSRFSDSSVPPNRRQVNPKTAMAQPVSIMSQSRGGSLDRRRQRNAQFKPPEFLKPHPMMTPMSPTPILTKKFKFEPDIEPQSLSRSIGTLPRHTVPPAAYTVSRNANTLPRSLQGSPRGMYRSIDIADTGEFRQMQWARISLI